MFEGFKKFINRGNVIDMAVGVLVGGAFGKIVTSLVNDIIMPPIGMLTGGVDFTELKVVLAEATEEVAEVSIKYGVFIQEIINFLIIAFSVYIFVSAITKAKEAKKKKESAPEPKPEEPKKPTQEELLTEIRDLLKTQAEKK